MNRQNEVKRVLQLITDKMMTRRYMNKVSRKQFKKKTNILQLQSFTTLCSGTNQPVLNWWHNFIYGTLLAVTYHIVTRHCWRKNSPLST